MTPRFGHFDKVSGSKTANISTPPIMALGLNRFMATTSDLADRNDVHSNFPCPPSSGFKPSFL